MFRLKYSGRIIVAANLKLEKGRHHPCSLIFFTLLLFPFRLRK